MGLLILIIIFIAVVIGLKYLLEELEIGDRPRKLILILTALFMLLYLLGGVYGYHTAFPELR